MRRLLLVCVVVAVALLAHYSLGQALFETDLVTNLLVTRRASVLACFGALLALRLFLVVLAPGWLVYELARVHARLRAGS